MLFLYPLPNQNGGKLMIKEEWDGFLIKMIKLSFLDFHVKMIYMD
jgi:hypothetical protein